MIRNNCKPNILGSVNKGRNKILRSGIVIKTFFDSRDAMKVVSCSAARPPSEQIREYPPHPGWKLANTPLKAVKVTTDASWSASNTVLQYRHPKFSFNPVIPMIIFGFLHPLYYQSRVPSLDCF